MLPFLAVLGPAELIVRGDRQHLPPKSLAVLLRLAVDAGESVPVEQVYRDVWNGGRAAIGRDERTQVQKAINDIRKAVSPLGRTIIETSRIGRTSSYRLLLDPDQIDFLYFRSLVEQSRRSDTATAVDLLRAASSLWRGSPMPEVAQLPFAGPVIRLLHSLRAAAERDLVQAYVEAGRDEEALSLAERLSAADPGDAGLSGTVAGLRLRLRSNRRDLLRRELRGPRSFVVSVAVGDIFAEDDAHVVVGFTDTFDTDTRADVVINGRSLQAEAARRLFECDRKLLDRRLRAALRNVAPQGRETRDRKRRGKLIRYPVGTVAVLRVGGRLLYAVAYSRMGNDMVARSSKDDLALSLERLWDAVYRYGQLRPVAVPLIGAGLSRIVSTALEEPISMIIESFVARNRSVWISPELRIVLRPEERSRIDLKFLAEELEKYQRHLDLE